MCISEFIFCERKTAYGLRISDWSSDVCSSDLAFVIERFDPGDEIDFAVIVRMEPGDGKMATCADDQLVGLLGIRGSPNDHRLAIGPFLPDRFNEGSAAVIAERRVIARIA